MAESKSMNILKNAILLEKRGKALYESFARHTSIKDVSDFFTMMAEEEQRHIELLSEQFKHFNKTGSFMNQYLEGDSTIDRILTTRIVASIGTADFEAAAVSAAINMEQKAVRVYSEQAEAAEDTEEKKLYRWLSEWEKKHLEFLQTIDEQLRENIWFDNHFWPM